MSRPAAAPLSPRQLARLRRSLRWTLHCGAYGAGLGLVAVAVEALTFGWRGSGSPSAALAVTGVELGLNVGLGACLGLATASIRRRHPALAAALVTAAFSAWVLVRGASFALRLLTGAFLSRMSIQFALNSGQELMRAIATQYAPELFCLALVAAVQAGVAWRTLRRGRAGPLWARARWAAALGLLSCIFSLTWLHARGARAEELRTQYARVGGLALLSSYVSDGPPRPPAAAAYGGPAIAESERAWRAAVRPAASAPASVLLITLESVAPRFVGSPGPAGSASVTPRLDAIVRRSLRFERAWATASHSNYAQMSILSSLFPRRREGLDMYRRLDYPRVLFHDVLHDLGYRTATISSQDENWQGMRRFQATETPTYYFHSADYEGDKLSIGSEEVVPDHVTTDHALYWLGRHAGQRWALYLNFQATHFPYPLPEGEPRPFRPTSPTPGEFDYFDYPETDREVALNRYRNALSYVDRQIGRIEDYLRATSQLQDTLWVITADHGELFHEHGFVTHGRTLHEQETRVPLAFHWPAALAPGSDRRVASQLDVMPTLAGLLGIPPHPAWQGRDLRGPDAAGQAVFMNLQGAKTVEGVVCWPWKLTHDRLTGAHSLYALDRDPQELRDLAREEPARRQRLAALLERMVSAQLEYHDGPRAARERHYAPRLPRCTP